MSDAAELLDFLAPAIADASTEDKQSALSIAKAYRPQCLPENAQDEAQAWYAAWLLYRRMQQQAAGIIPVGIASEKEGDLSRTYRDQANDGSDDPMGFLNQYQRLADLCGRGAIVVGRSRADRCEGR